MIDVLICEEQELIAEGLRLILGAEPDIRVTGVAYNGAQALAYVKAHQPDIVLMELDMPVMNGVRATCEIRALYPAVRVIVLTASDADAWVFDAIRAGAAGYLLKDTSGDDLITAVRQAAHGLTPVDPSVAGKLFRHVIAMSPVGHDDAIRNLSEREMEILGHIATGASNAEIAERVCLSQGTVRNYVSEVFSKIGVSDRTQAALFALRHGIQCERDIVACPSVD